MPSDPMTMERVEEIESAWETLYVDGQVSSRNYGMVRDLCTALMEAWKERDKALGGIKQLAESNRKLRAELNDHEKVVTYG